MTDSEQVSRWCIAVPALAVLIVWVAVAWFPTSRTLDDLQGRSDSAATERLALIADVDEVRQLEADRAETIDRGRRLEAALPSSAQIDQFVRSVDRITTEHDVVVNRLSPVAVETSADGTGTALPAGVTAVSMTLGATGTYADVMAFIGSFTSLDRIVVVDSLALATKGDGSGVLDLDVGFRVFTGTSNAVQEQES